MVANRFKENGFEVITKAIAKDVIEQFNLIIRNSIQQCAAELNCTIADYCRNVSRWLHPSPLSQTIYETVIYHLQPIAHKLIDEEVKLAKMNIISKSAYAAEDIPCHQDIAYSANNPYQFSLWLALHDVTLTDGVMEVLPQSHLTAIEPAIDFWQPHFIDNKFITAEWQEKALAMPLLAGDAVAFDSRLWHRSAKNQSGNDRFALVTRWTGASYQPAQNIPEKKLTTFGMWTCGRVTESLLQQGLRYCFETNSVADLDKYVELFLEKLSAGTSLPFAINLHNAKKALNDVLILHRAAQQHNGGDAQGIVFRKLWHELLYPLSQWINNEVHHETTI